LIDTGWPDLHVSELVFLEVGLDPGLAGEQPEGRLRRVQIGAHRQLFDAGDDAVGRRDDGGVGDVELGALKLGLGLHHSRRPTGR
jgi:hypothetical protein